MFTRIQALPTTPFEDTEPRRVARRNSTKRACIARQKRARRQQRLEGRAPRNCGSGFGTYGTENPPTLHWNQKIDLATPKQPGKGAHPAPNRQQLRRSARIANVLEHHATILTPWTSSHRPVFPRSSSTPRIHSAHSQKLRHPPEGRPTLAPSSRLHRRSRSHSDRHGRRLIPPCSASGSHTELVAHSARPPL